MVFLALPHYWGYNGDIQVDSGYVLGNPSICDTGVRTARISNIRAVAEDASACLHLGPCAMDFCGGSGGSGGFSVGFSTAWRFCWVRKQKQ